MVCQGGFTIKVGKRGAVNQYFPEVLHNGQVYIVAEPGQDFYVRVEATEPMTASGCENFAELKVDGQGVGYGKYITPAAPVTFDGFLVSCKGASTAAKGHSTTYSAFKFGSPKEASAPRVGQQNLEDSPVGKLRVEVSTVRVVGTNAFIPQAGPTVKEASVASLPDGKKFFLAPSLACQTGQQRAENTRWRTDRTEKVLTLADVTIRYETAPTLVLRKILDPKNPTHAVALAAGGWKAPNDQGVEGGGQSSGRVKRERQERAGSSDVIDLVSVRLPPLMRKDEEVTCDLTSPTPQWEVKKKPKVTPVDLV